MRLLLCGVLNNCKSPIGTSVMAILRLSTRMHHWKKGTADHAWAMGRPQSVRAKTDVQSLAWVQWSASPPSYDCLILPGKECKGCLSPRWTHRLLGDAPPRKGKSQVTGKYSCGDGEYGQTQQYKIILVRQVNALRALGGSTDSVQECHRWPHRLAQNGHCCSRGGPLRQCSSVAVVLTGF